MTKEEQDSMWLVIMPEIAYMQDKTSRRVLAARQPPDGCLYAPGTFDGSAFCEESCPLALTLGEFREAYLGE